MENAKGKIDLFGVQQSPHLLAKITKQMERWIEGKSAMLQLPKEAEYRVKIVREDSTHIFSCRISVRIGHSEWIGYETGQTLQAALTLALRSMEGTVLPFPQIPLRNPTPSPFVA
jgi:hypothetical protein